MIYSDHDVGCNDVVVKSWIYPPVISQFDMENGLFSSVFLRIRNDFTIVVSSYQRSPWEIMMKWEPTESTNWKQCWAMTARIGDGHASMKNGTSNGQYQEPLMMVGSWYPIRYPSTSNMQY